MNETIFQIIIYGGETTDWDFIQAQIKPLSFRLNLRFLNGSETLTAAVEKKPCHLLVIEHPAGLDALKQLIAAGFNEPIIYVATSISEAAQSIHLGAQEFVLPSDQVSKEMLLVPMIDKWIQIYRREQDRFDRLQVEQQIEMENLFASVIDSMLVAISSSMVDQEYLVKILGQLGVFLDVDFSSVLLYGKQENLPETHLEWVRNETQSNLPGYEAFLKSPIFRVLDEELRKGNPFIYPNNLDQTVSERLIEISNDPTPITAALIMPIMAGDDYYGFYHISKLFEPYHWTERDLKIAKSAVDIFLAIWLRWQSEEALQKSEKRYRAVVEDQGEMIVRWSPDGRHTFVNQVYCDYLGKTREELLRANIYEFEPPDAQEQMRRNLSQLTPDHPISRNVNVSYDSEHNERWQEWINRAIFDDGGNVIEYQAVGRDIHNQRLAEIALKESEERYRVSMNSLPVGVQLINRNYRLLLVNDEYRRSQQILMHASDQVIGMNLFDALPVLDRGRVSSEYEQVFTEGKTLITEETHQQGRRLYFFEVHKVPLFEGDQVTRVMTVVYDLSEQRYNQRRLEFQHQVSERLMKNLPPEEEIQEVLDQILQKYSIDRCMFFFCDDETSKWTLMASAGLTSEMAAEITATVNECCTASFEQPEKITLSRDDEIDGPMIRELEQFGCKTAIHYPILSGQKVIARLVISSQSASQFTDLAEMCVDSIQSQLTTTTHRIIAEKAKEKSEEHYRLLADSITDVVTLFDLNFNPIYVSPSYTRLTGLDLAHFAQYRKQFIDAARRAFKHPAGDTTPTKEFTFEWSVPHKDGKTIYLESKVHLLRHEKSRQPLWLSSARDISERKSAEEELQQMVSILEERNQQISTMNQMGLFLQQCTSLNDLYEVIQNFVLRLFPGTEGSLWVMKAPMNVNEDIIVWHNEKARVIKGKHVPGYACQVVNNGMVKIYPPDTPETVCDNIQSVRNRIDGDVSTMCLPLMAQADPIGGMSLHLINRNTIPDELRELATSFVERVGLAIANLTLREELQYQSMRDPLTGLYNRRFMEQFLEKEMHRAARHNYHVSVFMLDVDHFKQFNDTYGHDFGDLLIKTIGEFLTLNMRKEDIVCRYGGDEFVLILPETSIRDAMYRAEQIRNGAKQILENPAIAKRNIGELTFSIGISCTPTHGLEPPEVLRAADRALYRSKRNGRNQVQIANLGETGMLRPYHLGRQSTTKRSA
ncbi:MAG: diguanylate cyclase [Anaerolineaceae bacterium]|nr:diguanylate cyclase [Anaerolineaceae bacterium]